MSTLHSALQSFKKQPGVSDFILLPGKPGEENCVSEEAFLKNLKDRFQQECIYTYIGDVIVSINPFKPLVGMYGAEAVKMYRGKYYYEVPPHIFALTDDAYRDMSSKRRDQCIIISGESGSGKTEASKLIMQYIASIAASSEDVNKVKDMLLKSNPVLEAFGNAKTNRNNNSSRFGKYMDIQFNYKGDPVGGHINNYLLERSRVVGQSKNERSFHIMYYLIESQQDYLKLPSSADEVGNLNKSGCTKIPAINDKREFDVTVAALKAVGFSPESIQSLFKVVGGIMHLSNVNFARDQKDGVEVASASKKSLELAAELFQCPTETLQEAMLFRTVAARSEAMKTVQSVEQALYARDALSKTLYSRLFDWIVAQINDRITHDAENSTTVIGVLDIFGFEVFETSNGFEQFCINYCNEKLQQVFISLTLKQEQEEYAREGIEWTQIQYFNNAVILDLIENSKIGIISTLDEECIRPGNSTDLTFLEKLNVRHGGANRKSTTADNASLFFDSKETLGKTDRAVKHTQFRLKHYAGNVTYDIEGFVDRNMDNLSRDIKAFLHDSKDPVISSLFPDGIITQEAAKRMITTSTAFKASLNDLVTALLSKAPHYVRCVKSNDKLSPGLFDDDICLHQVRYLGLLENVRVRRAGFAYRQLYERFVSRYRLTCQKIWPTYPGDAREGSALILKGLNVQSDGYRLGKTKIFIKTPNTLFMLEDEREKALSRVCVLIQKVWKGYKQRKVFKFQLAAYRIMCFYRKHKFRRYLIEVCKAFENVQNQPGLGKGVQWPAVKSISLQKTAAYLVQIQIRWRADQILKRVPIERHLEVRQKIETHDIFYDNKRFSIQRPFIGDYITSTEAAAKFEKFKAKIMKLGDKLILFADFVQKCDRGGKGAPRFVIVTDKSIHVVHPDFTSKKPPRPLQSLVRVTMTKMKKDYLVILHLDKGGDYLLDFSPAAPKMEEHLSEFVTVLNQAYRKVCSKNADIEFSEGKIHVNTLGGSIDAIVRPGTPDKPGQAMFKMVRRRIEATFAEV